MRFPAGPLRPKNVTIEIPEVLIGEFLRYALRTGRLTPACADAQVFFILKIPPPHCFPTPSRVTCFDSSPVTWSCYAIGIFQTAVQGVIPGQTDRRHAGFAPAKSLNYPEPRLFPRRHSAGVVFAGPTGFCRLYLNQPALVYARADADYRFCAAGPDQADVDQTSGAPDRTGAAGGHLPGRANLGQRLADENL